MAPQQYPEPAEPLRAIRLGDDTVIALDAQLVLVSSKTEPSLWHVIDHGHCTCAGFRYRSTCRHARRVEDLQLIGALPTAAERVAARLDDPQERSFYDQLEAAADGPAAATELSRIFGKL